MKLVVGLGNPGEKYENNRHNIGFIVADRLQTTVYGDCEWNENSRFKAVVCRAHQSSQALRAGRPKAVDILLAKPQTFMNNSGIAVKKLVNFHKISPKDLYVIHDDLDIPIGTYKIQKGRGPKLHNGVLSIENALGTKDFWRVRVGVENRLPSNPDTRIPGESYVLQDFTKVELDILSGVIDKIVSEFKNPVT